MSSEEQALCRKSKRFAEKTPYLILLTYKTLQERRAECPTLQTYVCRAHLNQASSFFQPLGSRGSFTRRLQLSRYTDSALTSSWASASSAASPMVRSDYVPSIKCVNCHREEFSDKRKGLSRSCIDGCSAFRRDRFQRVPQQLHSELGRRALPLSMTIFQDHFRQSRCSQVVQTLWACCQDTT